MREIRHVDHAAIRTALSLGALDTPAINAQPDGGVPWLNQGVEPERTHLLLVDPSVLQRLIHAGPASGKEGRQRQFCQTARLTLAQESIAEIEQCPRAPLKAVIHLLTRLLQCVKVHPSKAPPCEFFGPLLAWAGFRKDASPFISFLTNQPVFL